MHTYRLWRLVGTLYTLGIEMQSTSLGNLLSDLGLTLVCDGGEGIIQLSDDFWVEQYD